MEYLGRVEEPACLHGVEMLALKLSIAVRHLVEVDGEGARGAIEEVLKIMFRNVWIQCLSELPSLVVCEISSPFPRFTEVDARFGRELRQELLLVGLDAFFPVLRTVSAGANQEDGLVGVFLESLLPLLGPGEGTEVKVIKEQ